MRRPPRKKNSPVLNGRLMARVLFSGTIIVLGTLFIYAYEISDGSMSRRDQTMVGQITNYTDKRPLLASSSLILSLQSNLEAWDVASSATVCSPSLFRYHSSVNSASFTSLSFNISSRPKPSVSEISSCCSAWLGQAWHCMKRVGGTKGGFESKNSGSWTVDWHNVVCMDHNLHEVRTRSDSDMFL